MNKKTKNYTRNANDKYDEKFDILKVRLFIQF